MGKHRRKDKDEDLYKLFKKFAKRMRKNSSDDEDDEPDTDKQQQEEMEIIQQANESVDPISEEPEVQVIEPHAVAGPSLDEDILQILGEDPNQNKIYSENIHNDISSRWSHIIQSGLDKEVKTELYKKYLIPENCMFLEAPMLNAEIKAAISEPVFKRDRALLNNQTNLGQVAGCLGKALDLLIKQKENKEITKIVSDAGRMICDIFHSESVSRRSLLQFALNKPTKDIVSQAAVGKYIFGDNLNEALKAGKAITRTGTEIKFSRPQNLKSSVVKPVTLNSRGPPRRFPPPQQPPSAGKPSSFKPKPAAAQQRRAAPAPRSSSGYRKN